MKPLTWRTYRDENRAPVPVAETDRARYRLAPREELPDRQLPVGEFESAVAIRSGETFESGQTLPASALSEDIVLARPTNDYGLSRVIARPIKFPHRPTAYRMPRMVGPDVALVPGDAKPSSGRWHVLDATPIRRGLFTVEPGRIGQAAARVQGQSGSTVFDYDPVSGAVYAETPDGEPLPMDAPLQLLVREHHTLRRMLSGARAPIVDERSGKVLAVAEREPASVRDVRRLPEYDPATRWHALDQAHYDAAPVADGHLWIIRTEAPTDRVRDAIRRTLPAGTVYRIEDPSDGTVETSAPDAKILDYVTGAEAAYSLKNIASFYSGPVVTLRRGSFGGDPIEYRSFSASEITDGTLAGWANGKDVWVAKLHDQSGKGNDAEQPALESQPVIVENGSIVSQNGQPAIHQKVDGALTTGLNEGIDDFTASVIGGAADLSHRPALFELDTVEATIDRRLVHAGDSGVWRYGKQKFEAGGVNYSPPNAAGMHAHLIQHVGGKGRFLFDEEPKEVELPDPEFSRTIRLLNDVNARSEGGMLQEAIFWGRGLSDYEEERVKVSAEQRYQFGE